MRLTISHGASGDWFVVKPLPGETTQSIVDTAITHEMAVEQLRKGGRKVITIHAPRPVCFLVREALYRSQKRRYRKLRETL